MPKVREDVKTKFKKEEIAETHMNYLYGGDGTGDSGDDDNDGDGNGPWNP